MTRRRALGLVALFVCVALIGLGVREWILYAASRPPAPDGVTWILWERLDVRTERADGRMVFERWDWEPADGFLSKAECVKAMPPAFSKQNIHSVCLPDTIKDPRPRAER